MKDDENRQTECSRLPLRYYSVIAIPTGTVSDELTGRSYSLKASAYERVAAGIPGVTLTWVDKADHALN